VPIERVVETLNGLARGVCHGSVYPVGRR
jgi:hypothetical protein